VFLPRHSVTCFPRVTLNVSTRVLDHDTYSAHDAIGKVYIDLDPLLSKENTSVFSGWFPIYDTMHGETILTYVYCCVPEVS